MKEKTEWHANEAINQWKKGYTEWAKNPVCVHLGNDRSFHR